MSTFNALEEGWKVGIRTAVLASSGSIYGTAWSPEPIDQPYGVRDCAFRDPAGNLLRFNQRTRTGG
jgi:hypothetical protein